MFTGLFPATKPSIIITSLLLNVFASLSPTFTVTVPIAPSGKVRVTVALSPTVTLVGFIFASKSYCEILETVIVVVLKP